MKFLAYVLVYAIIFVGVIVIGKSLSYYKCERAAFMMGTEYRYEVIGGCYIKDGDRYVPSKFYRVME